MGRVLFCFGLVLVLKFSKRQEMNLFFFCDHVHNKNIKKKLEFALSTLVLNETTFSFVCSKFRFLCFLFLFSICCTRLDICFCTKTKVTNFDQTKLNSFKKNNMHILAFFFTSKKKQKLKKLLFFCLFKITQSGQVEVSFK